MCLKNPVIIISTKKNGRKKKRVREKKRERKNRKQWVCGVYGGDITIDQRGKR